MSTSVMGQIPVPRPLADILECYCHVNAFTADWVESLKRELYNPLAVGREDLFRRQLAEAIRFSTLSPEQYEKLTGQDFDTQEELNDWLRDIWKELYGDRPVSTEG